MESILSEGLTSRTYTGKNNIQKGDIVELYNTETARTIVVIATSSEVPLTYVNPEEWSTTENKAIESYGDFVEDNYNYFTFDLVDLEELTPSEQVIEINPTTAEQLVNLIENNPNVIFVLEGSEASDDLFVPGIGKIKQRDNILALTTRIRPSDKAKDLWSNSSIENNKQLITESLDIIQELYDAGKKIAFLSKNKGYGAYMLDNNSQGKLIDSDTYKYLSTELFNRFKYGNKFSKTMTDTQTLIKADQEFKEFAISIPFNEMMEAQERLTCKT